MAQTRSLNRWRVARWSVAGLLLLTPAVMMQISDEWNWSAGSFVAAGILIGGVLGLYELIARAGSGWGYRAGTAVALAAGFLSVWATIVRDDGDGIGYFMVILAAAVGAFAAWLRPAGMARAMLGAATMQALLGVAIATAPVVAASPGGSRRALLTGAFFAGLWLASAALFWADARARQRA